MGFAPIIWLSRNKKRSSLGRVFSHGKGSNDITAMSKTMVMMIYKICIFQSKFH